MATTSNIPFREIEVGQTARLEKCVFADDIGKFASLVGSFNSDRNDRELATDPELDGLLAMGNVISEHVARINGIESLVVGHADILILPDLISGNVRVKSLDYLAGAKIAGVELRAPPQCAHQLRRQRARATRWRALRGNERRMHVTALAPAKKSRSGMQSQA